ncbi:pulmonary surfactant-associated protein D-like [Oscarella lobularis]|uniref:pulmonary surfactant-associated protein D-like n=1 Tax=Oscarella lobularis TaxID=121494 RepID=UPI0033131829
MHWSSIVFVFLCLIPLSCQNEDSSSNCPLQKGDKGLPGHSGSPGIRGHKGDRGTQGNAGRNGDKGDQGAKGSQGLPGKQGPAGVVGPPGSQGRQGATGPQGPRGNTGIQGETGIQGPKGQKGIQGIKGENGPTGPRGRGGIDGIPGPPGHTGQAGPKGPKGDKGERGLNGHKGERGLQGIPGPDIDEEIMKKLKEQIVTDLKSSLGTILKPTAYLVGNGAGSWQTYSSGQVITHWSTSTSGSHPSVLQGGMTYSNGYITVPESGIYFIYFNLNSSVLSNGGPYPAIYVDSLLIGLSYYHYENTRHKSLYLGMLWNVRKGSRLSVRAQEGSIRHFFSSQSSCFGAWKIN